jgi:hypothetical protein
VTRVSVAIAGIFGKCDSYTSNWHQAESKGGKRVDES